MKQMLRATIVIGLIIGFMGPLCAEEPKAPASGSGSAQPGGPPIGAPMSPGALMGLLGALPKAGAAPASPPQVPYPMFQFLGPSLLGDGSVNPETMGHLLRLQGELMIKMGEVLMKYGQKMGEKSQ